MVKKKKRRRYGQNLGFVRVELNKLGLVFIDQSSLYYILMFLSVVLYPRNLSFFWNQMAYNFYNADSEGMVNDENEQ